MFRKILYGLLFIIALTIYALQRLHFSLPSLINNYLNDLLYVPIALGAIQFIIRRLKKDPLFQLPLGFILFLSSFYSFYFEYYLPKVNVRYTADWIDVLLYFIGGVVFFLLQRRNKF
ncbi:hypothetical protein MW871_00615 [Flavobacterium sp. I-SCBP12n]|uniref:Magnesium citrate secondary transporter n=1 Tax=Flavobacterium pygoscelis TaxID=2893176 RepID=A0A9X1XNV5_9FLAO|nr:hypothetical protein [Flavobacterium pygoscelis]MCK8140384.1 hypothetical protein [Flavobacterium pygoscelis]